MDQRAASSTFSTSAVSRPVFTDTASTNCCLVICSSVPAIAQYRFTTVTTGLCSCCDDRCRRLSPSKPSPTNPLSQQCGRQPPRGFHCMAFPSLVVAAAPAPLLLG